MSEPVEPLPVQPLEYESPRERERRKKQVLYPLPYVITGSDPRLPLALLLVFILVIGMSLWLGDVARGMIVVLIVSLLGLAWHFVGQQPVLEITEAGIVPRGRKLIPWVEILRARQIGNGITFTLYDECRVRVSFLGTVPRDVEVLRQVLKDRGL